MPIDDGLADLDVDDLRRQIRDLLDADDAVFGRSRDVRGLGAVDRSDALAAAGRSPRR